MGNMNKLRILTSLKRSDYEEIRLTDGDFKVLSGINLRMWYKDSGEWLPSKEGVQIKPEEIGTLINALKQIQEENR